MAKRFWSQTSRSGSTKLYLASLYPEYLICISADRNDTKSVICGESHWLVNRVAGCMGRVSHIAHPSAACLTHLQQDVKIEYLYPSVLRCRFRYFPHIPRAYLTRSIDQTGSSLLSKYQFKITWWPCRFRKDICRGSRWMGDTVFQDNAFARMYRPPWSDHHVDLSWPNYRSSRWSYQQQNFRWSLDTSVAGWGVRVRDCISYRGFDIARLSRSCPPGFPFSHFVCSFYFMWYLALVHVYAIAAGW